jgi:hypothetical protein
MSNLSELLPTGGGQNAVDFVASGTLSSGQTVILKTNGQVEAVSGTSGSQTVYSQYSVGSNSSIFATVFSPDANKVVIIYANSNNYPTAVVASISGTALSFGTPTVIESYATYHTDAVYDTNADRVVVCIGRDSFPRYGVAYAGTISGTGISFGSEVDFKDSSSNAVDHCRCTFDETSNRTVVVYCHPGNSSILEGRAISCSGSSLTVVTPEVYIQTTTSSGVQAVDVSYDSAQGCCIVAFVLGSNTNQYYRAFTTTGSSFAFSQANQIGTSIQTNSAVAAINYDANAQKHLAVFRDSASNNYGYLVPISVSGTTVTIGTASTGISTALENGVRRVAVYYDTTAQKSTVVQLNSSSTKIYPVDLTGSSPTVGTTITSQGATGSSYTAAVFVPTQNRAVLAQRNTNGTVYANLYQNDYVDSNFASFIGITAEAISSAATGAVNVYGGINEAQSGLTIGSDYYVQADGSLSTATSTVKAGKAITATTINMMDLT